MQLISNPWHKDKLVCSSPQLGSCLSQKGLEDVGSGGEWKLQPARLLSSYIKHPLRVAGGTSAKNQLWQGSQVVCLLMSCERSSACLSTSCQRLLSKCLYISLKWEFWGLGKRKVDRYLAQPLNQMKPRTNSLLEVFQGSQRRGAIPESQRQNKATTKQPSPKNKANITLKASSTEDRLFFPLIQKGSSILKGSDLHWLPTGTQLCIRCLALNIKTIEIYMYRKTSKVDPFGLLCKEQTERRQRIGGDSELNTVAGLSAITIKCSNQIGHHKTKGLEVFKTWLVTKAMSKHRNNINKHITYQNTPPSSSSAEHLEETSLKLPWFQPNTI